MFLTTLETDHVFGPRLIHLVNLKKYILALFFKYFSSTHLIFDIDFKILKVVFAQLEEKA